jgi:hypothetical protein
MLFRRPEAVWVALAPGCWPGSGLVWSLLTWCVHCQLRSIRLCVRKLLSGCAVLTVSPLAVNRRKSEPQPGSPLCFIRLRTASCCNTNLTCCKSIVTSSTMACALQARRLSHLSASTTHSASLQQACVHHRLYPQTHRHTQLPCLYLPHSRSSIAAAAGSFNFADSGDSDRVGRRNRTVDKKKGVDPCSAATCDMLWVCSCHLGTAHGSAQHHGVCQGASQAGVSPPTPHPPHTQPPAA